MKNFILSLLLICSLNVFGQDLDGLFLLNKSDINTELINQNWKWSDGCYKGVYLENERDLYLNYYEDSLVSIRLVFSMDSEFSVIADFYKILDYMKDYPMWRVCDDYWIIYKNQYEITIQKTWEQTEMIIVNTKIENKQILIR